MANNEGLFLACVITMGLLCVVFTLESKQTVKKDGPYNHRLGSCTLLIMFCWPKLMSLALEV